MARDCGWVEVMREEGDEVLARGRAVLNELPAASDITEWGGELSPLRPSRDVARLDAGRYRLRFEVSGEVRSVSVEHPVQFEPGEAAHVPIQGVDAEPPRVLVRPLGGE